MQESGYLDIMKDIVFYGDRRKTRNAETRSVFGKQLRFDLSSFPLLTTKKLSLRIIFEELMFFIRGQTNTTILEKKNINIWKGNTSRKFMDDNDKKHLTEGDMGHMYGYQWRNFNSGGIDQLKYVIETIKYNPNSRRIMMTSYNPEQAEHGVLYPCHGIVIQFYVSNGKLSCHMYQRSADWFLGVPFNIASYALLTYLIAKHCDLGVNELLISFGDCHIYEEHVTLCSDQLLRCTLKLPTLVVKRAHNDICDYEFDDIELRNYKSHEKLTGAMVA